MFFKNFSWNVFLDFYIYDFNHLQAGRYSVPQRNGRPSWPWWLVIIIIKWLTCLQTVTHLI